MNDEMFYKHQMEIFMEIPGGYEFEHRKDRDAIVRDIERNRRKLTKKVKKFAEQHKKYKYKDVSDFGSTEFEDIENLAYNIEDSLTDIYKLRCELYEHDRCESERGDIYDEADV